MDLIPALLEEKKRVLARGLIGRAEQIDVQLAAYGYKPPVKKTARKKTAERADEAAPERAVGRPPVRR
jgi:hypothetical protein